MGDMDTSAGRTAAPPHGARAQTPHPAGGGPGEHGGHGNSVAAWSCVGIMMFGFLLGSIGMVFMLLWLIALGAGVIIAGLVVGKVLSNMGYGVHGDRGAASQPGGHLGAHQEG